MSDNFIATASAELKAPIETVWEWLTKPELVKQYFFGVDLVTDWKIGSDITYKGEWEGAPFEEKGTVLKVDKPKQLISNYWSPSSGLPDTLENRQEIIYGLEVINEGTKLTITQSGNKTPEAAKQSESNWNSILDGLKKLLEKNM